MNYKSICKLLILFFTIINYPVSYASEPGNSRNTINMTISKVNKQAKQYFLSGVLSLHNFQYNKARDYFQLAIKSDPDFAMAYWGEAMTYNHPLWHEQDYDLAKITLNKLAPTNNQRLEKAATPIEKGLIKSVNILYGSGSKKERDKKYQESLYELYKSHPGESEVGIFYALAILGSQEERNFKPYMQAAGILEEIYQKEPYHPGVIHYLIHSYDDPIHAPLGLRFAREYAKIAPDSSHALHMPSHIYLALGMWDDVYKSNLASWEVGLKHKQEYDDYDIHSLHSLEWMSYALLQKKNYNEAYKSVKKMEAILKEDPNSAMKKWYYTLTRAYYIIETEDYDLYLNDINLTGIESSAAASDLYVHGMKLIKSDPHNHSEIQKIVDKLYTLSLESNIDNSESHSEKDYFTTMNKDGSIITKIYYLQLKAQIVAKENLDHAIEFAKQAINLEDSLSFGYGPPLPIKPSNELLSELYSKNKQFALSYSELCNSLARYPNRTISKENLYSLSKMMEKPEFVD